MAFSNTSKTVAALAVAGGLGLAVFRAQNGVADCVANVSPTKAVFPFCKGEAAGALPHCYLWPMKIGPRALYRMGRPSIDAGVAYDYGAGFGTLSDSEVTNAATLLPLVLSRLGFDDADDVPDLDAVKEITCPGTPPRAAIVMRDDALFQSPCACSSGASCTYTPPGGSAGAKPKDGNTMAAGTWSGAGCVPMPCVLSAGSPWLPGACL